MAANDAAALVVALSAQLTQFQKDMDDAGVVADEGVKKIEDRFSKLNPDASGMLKSFATSAQQPAQEAGNAIGTAILVGMGAAITAIVARMGSVVDGLAKIGDRGEELRLPVNLLQALSIAADEARLPQDKLNSALDKFTEVSKKSADDSKDFYKALSNIGAGFEEAFKNAPTQEARLRIVSNALHSTTNEVKLAQLSLEAFGTDSARALQVFGTGSAGIDEVTKQMHALGLEIDVSAVKRAQDAKAQLSLLAKVITDELSSSLGGLIPTFVNLLPYMERLAGVARDVLAIFASSDSAKPIETLQNEVSTLQAQITSIEALRARTAASSPSMSDSLRDKLRAIIGPIVGVDLSENVADLDKQIAAIKARIDTVKALIAQKNAASAAPSAPAFKARPGLSKSDDTTAFDHQVDSINRHIAALNADAVAVGLTTAAHDGLRTELSLLQALQRDDAGVTNEQIDRYTALRATMNAQQALTASGITLNKEHAETFAEVTTRMVDTAQKGDDLKRSFAGMNSAIQFGGNQAISIMDGLRNHTLTASQAVVQLGNAFITAAEQALLLGSGPLASIFGSQSNIPGGTGGLLGGIVGMFKGGGTKGVVTPIDVPFGPGLAGGTDNWRGGPTWVGENGPEILNLPKGSQVTPNAVAARSGGGGPTVNITQVITLAPSGISATDAAFIRGQLDQTKRETVAVTLQAIRTGRSNDPNYLGR